MVYVMQEETQTIVNASLPLESDQDIFLDAVKAREFGEELSGTYCFAEPYPHVVIDNFLPKDFAENLLSSFPTAPVTDETFYQDGLFQHNKRQISPFDCNGFAMSAFHLFNSAPFLQFLEGLTTIQGLLPDPYFEGGGFHEILKDGKLGIHADFRVHSQLHLHRRINVLIYLNKDWEENYGGCLEIWDRAMTNKVRGILPLFNRCVIFNTDADSFHGHPDPLNTPDHVTRKSIALYYYTASQAIYSEIPSYTTRFKARPSDEQNIQSAAFKWQLKSYFRYTEWLPPVLVRSLRTMLRKMRKT